MNVHDSDRMRRMILDAGYAEVNAYEDADVVILNTCYVRENAVDRVRGHLGELNRLKREGRVKKVALTGCIGAAEESNTLRSQFGIDLVLGTHNTYELGGVRGAADDGGDLHAGSPGDGGRARGLRHDNDRLQLPVQLLHSPDRQGQDGLQEQGERDLGGGPAGRLGTKYVTLLGQTVDAWRHEGDRFCDLLEAVADRAPRVSFTTSHPSNMEDRTLGAIGEKETVVKRLHLPVQSGSDRMLRVMHRGYKAERYRRKIGVFRDAAPDGTLSTDIIVGHPGETEEDHEATLRLVEDCSFDSAYVFKFSPRAGTEAAALGEVVPPGVAQRRFVEVCGPWRATRSRGTGARSAPPRTSTCATAPTTMAGPSARPGAGTLST
jgi:tRNA-2-methylthio-N6-dimethylallyladenosine synthase